MSKRLFTSAVIATLMMAATTFYSATQMERQETASLTMSMEG